MKLSYDLKSIIRYRLNEQWSWQNKWKETVCDKNTIIRFTMNQVPNSDVKKV